MEIIIIITSIVIFIFLYFQICGVFQDYLEENLTMFWLYTICRVIKLLQSFYILATSFKTHLQFFAFRKNC